MQLEDHLRHLRTHAAALAEATRADPTAAVASCPGWDRLELLGHVGVVHSWVRAQLAAGPSEKRGFRDAERPPEDGAARLAWFEDGAATLADGLARIDPDEPWPTWSGPQPGRWFARRMAQETAVHRWDADPVDLDPDLAVDGLDELFELFAARLDAARFADVDGTVHLHATDEGLAEPGEYLVTLSPAGVTAEKVHRKGDVALRGPAADLLLWTWNRIPTDRLDVIGDAALARRWAELVVV